MQSGFDMQEKKSVLFHLIKGLVSLFYGKTDAFWEKGRDVVFTCPFLENTVQCILGGYSFCKNQTDHKNIG